MDLIPAKYYKVGVKCICLACIFFFGQNFIVVRHDVADSELRKLVEHFPAVCYFADGAGTLIHPRWILTAAHVVELIKDPEDYREQKVEIAGRFYPIDTIILAPDYSLTKHHIQDDLAMARLTEPVMDVVPAKLNRSNAEKGTFIYLVGRGDFGTGLTGPVKRDGISRAASNYVETTTDQWITFTFDHPDSTAATTWEGVSGPGDSGGPAFSKKGDEILLMGVSSHQRDVAGKGRYGAVEYYVRVSQYTNWISEVIN